MSYINTLFVKDGIFDFKGESIFKDRCCFLEDCKTPPNKTKINQKHIRISSNNDGRHQIFNRK